MNSENNNFTQEYEESKLAESDQNNPASTNLNFIFSLKSKYQDEDFHKKVEKNRKKKEGIIGTLKGIEEHIEISKKFFYPYWIVKYTYSQKKGLLKKNIIDVENTMIADAFKNFPCSNDKIGSGLKKSTIHEILIKAEFVEANVANDIIVVPSNSYNDTINEVDTLISETLKQIDSLYSEAENLKFDIEPLEKEMKDIEYQMSRIREKLDETERGRYSQSIKDFAGGGARSILSGNLDTESLKKGIQHAQWKPTDDEAIYEGDLKYNLEQLRQVHGEYTRKVYPVRNKINQNIEKAQNLKDNLRLDINLPKKAMSISNYLDGKLVYYSFWCAKYKGIDRKGRETYRWLVFDCFNGNTDNLMIEKVQSDLNYLI